jgi:CheY-like chemotaxis protein
MGSAASPCHIILAEDNPADVGLVRAALHEHQVECDLRVISDGEEVLTFLEKIDQNSALPCPDLFLLDLHLPKRDGSEILIRLRASERCGQTPVVILTSSDSPWDQETAQRNAALHYFRKPSSLSQFMRLGTIVKQIVSHGPLCSPEA